MKAFTGTIGSKLIGVLATSLVGACASGGGDTSLPDVIACLTTAPLGGAGCPHTESTSSGPQPTPQFTSWAAMQRDTPTKAEVLGTSVDYRQTPSVDITKPVYALDYHQDFSIYYFAPATDPSTGSDFLVAYDTNGRVKQFGPLDPSLTFASRPGTLAASGQPGIETRMNSRGVYPQSPFTDIASAEMGVFANPFDLGWNYQTFGVWNGPVGAYDGRVAAWSIGNVTPGSAIPTTGTATFNGKLAGLYSSSAGIGWMASADLKVDANFSTRSLNFASTATMTARDLGTAVAAPGLNLSGTLAYSAGTNSFSGTLTSANGMSGSSNGRFYGPSAQELGGVFTVRSSSTVETFTGAYGAKR